MAPATPYEPTVGTFTKEFLFSVLSVANGFLPADPAVSLSTALTTPVLLLEEEEDNEGEEAEDKEDGSLLA